MAGDAGKQEVGLDLSRRIVVVEDEPLMRTLIASALERFGFLVSTAADAAEGTQICLREDPDALVVDIELGDGPTGLDLVASLHAVNPHLGVVFLTRVPDARFVGGQTPARSLNVAWLRKQDVADPGVLAAALETVLRDGQRPQPRTDLDPGRPLAELTRTQVELLRLIAEGLSNEEIARRRGTSVRAVEHLIRRTFAAAGVGVVAERNARVQAVRLIAAEAALPQ